MDAPSVPCRVPVEGHAAARVPPLGGLGSGRVGAPAVIRALYAVRDVSLRRGRDHVLVGAVDDGAVAAVDGPRAAVVVLGGRRQERRLRGNRRPHGGRALEDLVQLLGVPGRDLLVQLDVGLD